VEEECVLEESTIPKCYHFSPHQDYIRSPKIPVVIIIILYYATEAAQTQYNHTQ